MKLEDYLKNGRFYIWKETFAIIKVKQPLHNAFAIIQDKNEITAVINQIKFDQTNIDNIIEADKSWRLITFDMILPFGLIGFLAKIAKILADGNISIFVISAYSTDHVLVKEKDLEKAINQLENLGLKAEYKK